MHKSLSRKPRFTITKTVIVSLLAAYSFSVNASSYSDTVVATVIF